MIFLFIILTALISLAVDYFVTKRKTKSNLTMTVFQNYKNKSVSNIYKNQQADVPSLSPQSYLLV